jgi:hypothetical protein
MMQPEQQYSQRVQQFSEELKRLKKISSLFAWGRLAVIIILLAGGWFTWQHGFLIAIITIFILLVVFIRLVIMDTDNANKIKQATNLLLINQNELDIAAGKYTNLPNGIDFVPRIHDNAYDLDLFGRASLYQYINRTTSAQGNATIANWLLNSSSVDIIIQRQDAIKELSENIEFRQKLQALGMEDPVTIQTEKKLTHWLQQQNIFSRKIIWKIIRYIYPIISLGFVVLFMYDIIQPSLFYPLLLLFFIFSGALSKKISPEYNQINKIEPEIDTLYRSVAWIEDQKWQSIYLQQIQQQFATSNVSASSAIKKFKKILDRFDMRLNFVLFIPLNIFFLWDLQIVFQLESWRDRFSKVMSGWFSALGEAEAINSLAILKFNHSHWVFPVFDTKNKGTLSAKDLGHPLIPADKCVLNSFSTETIGQIALITGSNMAGKSTFLRSIGVNIVLAMMGSPVYASLMKLSPVSVISSMRITDNLEESTSTFYAELKKLKHIIECCNRHENVFLLLDEILRGTNSLDRHTGSVALLRQLLKQDAVGILATHDLELAQLANEFPVNIHNFHFDVSVQNDELFFDYKLKNGICQSMNATILMKKIGIDL